MSNKLVESKLFELFQSIDTDSSGHISLDEFKEACERISLKVSREEVEAFLKADTSGDNNLDFPEFCQFYTNCLSQVFRAIDTDNSGHIGTDELKHAFAKLGHNVTEREVIQLIYQVDKDRSGSVDFEEFCNYFISLPSPTMRAVMEQWSSGLSVDVGTDLATPPMPPPSVTIWRALLAGGVAGVVSRTATAPLEKIKLLAQVQTTCNIIYSLYVYTDKRWHQIATDSKRYNSTGIVERAVCWQCYKLFKSTAIFCSRLPCLL